MNEGNPIMELARQANLPSCHLTHPKALARFAALVRAQAMEEVEKKVPCGKHTDKWESCRIADYNQGWNDYRKQCAVAIQALKEQT